MLVRSSSFSSSTATSHSASRNLSPPLPDPEVIRVLFPLQASVRPALSHGIAEDKKKKKPRRGCNMPNVSHSRTHASVTDRHRCPPAAGPANSWPVSRGDLFRVHPSSAFSLLLGTIEKTSLSLCSSCIHPSLRRPRRGAYSICPVCRCIFSNNKLSRDICTSIRSI